MNNVSLVGRLTKDVELRFTQNGTATANFTLAVNRAFTGKDKEREADFINIVVWQKQAENVAKYVGKGSLVSVTGRIQVRNYEDKEGKRVYVTEVVADSVQFLDSKKENTTTGEHPATEKTAPTTTESTPFEGGTSFEVNEDDLPF